MNISTIAGFSGGTGRNQILSQTLASTTETEFRVQTDNAAGAIAVLSLPSQSAILGSSNPLDINDNAAGLVGGYGMPNPLMFAAGAPYFNSASFDNGLPFLLRLAGVVTPASNAANSLTLKFYQGTSKSGNNIASTGALTGTESSTQAGAFIMEAQLNWDSVGQIIGGQFWWSVAAGATPSYNTWKALTANQTGVTLANMKFCASAQWGNAAGGVIAVSEFSLGRM